ncbi:MAG: restriction endonuclease subunit S [Thermodesulfobacteriota bacterium]|nr:restriction endonuclease subunit S [Thermodesulfobacteriota bacterium]
MNNTTLPEGWNFVKLSEIADLKNGGTPSKRISKYWENGSIPFVTAADLTSLYVEKARSYVTPSGLYSGKTVVCEQGDLLIGTRTRVGNCAIAKGLMGASQDITRARFKKEVVIEYFGWFFRNIADFLSFYSQGTSIQGITRDVLNELEIPVPPLDEQQRIVTRIEALTHRANEIRQILKKADAELSGFIPSLLSRAFRGEL